MLHPVEFQPSTTRARSRLPPTVVSWGRPIESSPDRGVVRHVLLNVCALRLGGLADKITSIIPVRYRAALFTRPADDSSKCANIIPPVDIPHSL